MPRLVPPAVPPADAAPALIAGRYEIQARLGSGAMGMVYKVRDVELDEIVALKLLRPELLGSSDVLDRFRREVKLARLVTHRNVARTFDIGEHQGQRFLTMEYLTGRSLAERLAKGPVPLLEALSLVQEICAGLGAAHQAGVVHRDLKPENIMLCDDGRVVITDFGIARGLAPSEPTAEGQRVTQPTVGMVGTPAYMAPEQVDQSTTPDARTDLYALGCMLFELFTGRLPWQGNSITEMLFPRLFKDPPDPRTVQPDLPDTVARVILRCLARAPAERPQSASEVTSALQTATLPLPSESLIYDRGAEAALAIDDRAEAPAAHQRAAAATPATSPPRPSRPPVSPLGDTMATPQPEAQRTLATPAEARRTQAGRSLAVLPFRNGGPAEDDYLAAGLTEDLIDSLSTVKGLRPRPRSAVLAYRDPDRDPQQAGKALGVEVVVEGSLRRAGGGLRVQVRVIHVEDGFQIWAKRFETASGDLLSICDDMAQAIAQALTAQSLEIKREGPSDPQALDLYLRARHEFHEPDRVHTLRATALFEEALALAPQDPVLLSAYALARARLWFFGGEAAEELARAAAAQAMAMAPNRGESHLALGVIRFQSGDFAGAVRALRDALRRAPALAEAYEYLGRILTESGPLHDGLRYLHDALSLEPALAGARIAMARIHGLLGEWEKADHALDLHHGPSDRAALWMTRARLCLWRGDQANARLWLQHPDLLSGRFPAVTQLLELTLGGTALRALGALTPLFPGSGSERARAFLLQVGTEMLAKVGELELAFETLQGVEEIPVIDLVWMDHCPLLAPLRPDPRFTRLRATVAARAALIHAALRSQTN